MKKYEPFIFIDGVKHYNCPECGGSGEQMEARMYPSGHTEVWVPCEFCEETGCFEEDDWLMLKLEGKV